ncbi:hypothetical protein [Paraclostridium sordellii]|uniref:hypothetical protein n=1 Tax=Paraclostridium sordellii TaxID=1505 RepID=UPI00038576C3|nr:hypothetical protein [Paeniclostridium sordellii]EPZ57512.1 hypothetical protein H476_0994 [[Clostridium] sordellii VPI 9048] [Paeniclostridium sordellii VPI 9048]CEK40039.1 hypothetical protein JGS6382_33671 [[Clostridium] sordellii] [Paeniclostridium sordellii]
MIFVSNDKVNQVFEILLKEEFKIADYTNLNNQLTSLHGKVKYGYISSFIKNMNPDKRDLLYKNAEFCIKVTEVDECNDILMQVINHIILEVPRANEFDSIGEQTKRYAEQNRKSRQIQRDFDVKVSDFQSEFNTIKEEFGRFENRIGNIQNEFIGILSIFSAIIIAFFGGIQVLGQVISNIKSANFYILIMVALVVGIIMFNIIYMLLYTISKLLSKNICIDISNEKCLGCNSKSRLKCLISKYPIIFWYNSFSIILFIIMFTFYNLDKYNILKELSKNFIWLISNGRISTLFLIAVSTVIVIIAIICFIIKPILKKYDSLVCTRNREDNTSSTSRADLETFNG